MNQPLKPLRIIELGHDSIPVEYPPLERIHSLSCHIVSKPVYHKEAPSSTGNGKEW